MNINKKLSEYIETIIPDFSDFFDQVPDITFPIFIDTRICSYIFQLYPPKPRTRTFFCLPKNIEYIPKEQP